jgi:RNA polymerase sigma-70 factor (ECF subfamily)
MVRNAQHERAMSEPEALARADEFGADRVRIELASLDAFVRAHYPRLVRLAGLITRDSDQAQDSVQAALERAWRKRGDVRDPARLRPWLDRIVAREAIRQTRRGGPAALLRRDHEDWIQYPSTLPEPAEVVGLREALGRLSPDHRAVIALHLHEGYSVEETAHVLAVPFDTVRSRLRAARARLRRDLVEGKDR